MSRTRDAGRTVAKAPSTLLPIAFALVARGWFRAQRRGLGQLADPAHPAVRHPGAGLAHAARAERDVHRRGHRAAGPLWSRCPARSRLSGPPASVSRPWPAVRAGAAQRDHRDPGLPDRRSTGLPGIWVPSSGWWQAGAFADDTAVAGHDQAFDELRRGDHDATMTRCDKGRAPHGNRADDLVMSGSLLEMLTPHRCVAGMAYLTL